jgi:hypothetical protein
MAKVIIYVTLLQIIKMLHKREFCRTPDGFLVSDTNLYFSYIDFDQYHAPPFDHENGCLAGLQRNYNTIFSVKGSALDNTKRYIGRFWIYNNGKNYGQDCLNGMIFFVKSKNGNDDWLFPL